MKEQKFSIYRKLCLLFLGTLIPIVIVTLGVNYLASVRIRKQGAEKLEERLASRIGSFDSELARIHSGLRFHVLSGEEAFLAINYYSLSSYQLGQRVAELSTGLNELMLMSGCIEDITVYLPQIERVMSHHKYYDDRIKKNDKERILNYQYINNGNLYDDGRLFVYIISPTDKDGVPLYVMEAALSNNKILTFIESGMENERYTLAGDDWFICDPVSKGIEPAIEEVRKRGDEEGNFILGDRIFCYQRMNLCDGWMIGYTEISDLMEVAWIFHFLMIVTLLLTILAIFLVFYLLSQSVNRPFQQLTYLFGEVENGKLDVKTDYRFQDEFRVVFDQFDSMLSRIRELLIQSVKKEKELQKAEYKQLQAHIAPHFLYNSFNVLRHCILLEDYETANDMAGLLGNYFRYITYCGEQDSISLLEEYEHMSDYLEIQKIRFQDNIEVSVDKLPERYNDLRVPPFILQPVVENIFKHGIKGMAYAGRISIQVEETEEKVCLTVCDNGAGISLKDLDKLRRSIKEQETVLEHSGLVNIEKRLKILLGEKAGLEVDSERNQFFKVVIEIPLEQKEREEYDSYTGG